MKKTISMILALAATVASADTLGTSTFDRTGTTVDSVTVSTTGDMLSLTLDSLSVNGADSTESLRDVTAGVLTPDINVGNAAGKSWTLSFTLTNTGSDTVTIDSIALSGYGTTGQNGQQGISGGTSAGTYDETSSYYVGFEGGSQNKPVDFSITGADQTWAINMGMNGNASRTATFTLSTPWTLNANESITFEVTAANSELIAYTSGTYAGIKQLSFNGSVAAATIPEPATATLSLLALAGLAARRRRK